MKIGYHCSHEQFGPKELFKYAIEAEKAGFKHISCSDHFAPWSQSQGHSGNAWCWIGAVLAATNLSCGTVCTPGYRYHPGLVAQMGATLAEMFPGRFWLALGSGEYLNEQFTGLPWPIKSERNDILKESYEIIHDLIEGKEITHIGHIIMETGRLYSLPKENFELLGAALSQESASFISEFADGLITSGPFDSVKKIIEEYKQKLKFPGRLILKLDVSYAKNRDSAIKEGWEQWKHVLVGGSLLSELRYPSLFEEASKFITEDHFAEQVTIATKPHEVEEAVQKFAALGFDQINLHNVNKEQSLFIREIGNSIK